MSQTYLFEDIIKKNTCVCVRRGGNLVKWFVLLKNRGLRVQIPALCYLLVLTEGEHTPGVTFWCTQFISSQFIQSEGGRLILFSSPANNFRVHSVQKRFQTIYFMYNYLFQPNLTCGYLVHNICKRCWISILIESYFQTTKQLMPW